MSNNLIALSANKLVLIDDLDQFSAINLQKSLQLLVQYDNKLLLAGTDGAFSFDNALNTLNQLVLPVTSISSTNLEPITAVDASSNILYFARENNLYSSDIPTKRIQLIYQGHTGVIVGLSLSRDQTHLASCSKAGALILHSIHQQTYNILNYHPREALSYLSFSPHSNNILCTGTYSGSLLIHNTSFIDDFPYLIFPKLHPSPIMAIDFSQASKSLVASVSRDGWIAVVDLDNKSVIRVISTGYTLNCLAFEGALLVAGTSDGRILVYNLRSGNAPQNIQCSTEAITGVVFQKDKRKSSGLRSRDYAVHFAEPLVKDDRGEQLTREKKSSSSGNLSLLGHNRHSTHSTSSLLSQVQPPAPPPKDLPVYMPSSAGALRPQATLSEKVHSDELLHSRPRRTSTNQPRPVSMATSNDSNLATVNGNLNATVPRRRRHSSRSERPRVEDLDWLKEAREVREKHKSTTSAPVSYHNTTNLKRSGSSASLHHSRTNSLDKVDKVQNQEDALKKLVDSAQALNLSSEIQRARDVLEMDYKSKLEACTQEIRKLRSENALLRRENDRLRRQS
ncbi:WD40 repeat-like protein [Wallemia mellicola]|uniref:WD40 repeat-like protein n=1 Tax=Wallemia mellicola TaxID=1708541 RepID=A0A4V4N1P2_9BASI|nr:hypothetical protein E3Q23_01092 [Wallemia mellicola]TIB80889.1 WD40 repeat-like protein [Wallemia mellicola]TIB93202.1 WD40 repeat-like protein [Wallemia mellicola]TIB99595.1 WD40 repeat-like protein [Wallemia mellicola]TIC12924.1 WD40 repeat-like protein [Wallemia mellicola]